MSPQRVLGVLLLAIGIVLVVVGVNATDSVGDRLSNFFTGQFTDGTVWYLLGGAALGIGGLVLLSVRLPKRSS